MKYLNTSRRQTTPSSPTLHFDKDRSERKKTGCKCNRMRLKEPLLVGNWARYNVDTARNVRLTLEIAAQNRSKEVQWENDERTDADDRELNPAIRDHQTNSITRHGREGNRSGRVVVDRHGVDAQRNNSERGGEEECPYDYLLDPSLATHPTVHAAT